MSITSAMVLPTDVVLVPVKDLPSRLREQVRAEDGDYALTRPKSRTPAKIIDSNAADLLKEFQIPKTIIQAVIHYSQMKQASAEQTLEEAYPLLQRLVHAGLLVAADSEDARQIRPSLEIGARFASFTILECMQVLEDVELYKVNGANGTIAALKLVRHGSGPELDRMLDREAAILKHLDGNVSPKLLETSKHEDRRYLLIEWCPGINASLAAAEFRRSGDAGNRQRLLQLCCAILDAYVRLHVQHVIHSDVHPRNVLVTGDDVIKIIDYGLAQLDSPENGLKCTNRGGVGFYFEPEYAQAVRAARRQPKSSELGEQYALAALLYLLLTGLHYLDFSLEKHEMLRQIVEDPPLPFSSHRIAAWPEVEPLLFRALSKNPLDRFSSVADFADALRRVAELAVPAGTTIPTGSPDVGDSAAQVLLNETLQRVAATGPLMTSGLQFAPTVSVTYGAAGIAYALYRLACVREDPTLLSLADIWATRGAGDIAKSEAFYSTEIDISQAVVGRISPYHTASGLHCVQALIGHAMGDMMSVQASLQAFVAAASGICKNLDVTLGRSGVLLSSSLLLNALARAPLVDTTAVVSLGNEIFNEVWEEIDSFAPILEDSEIKYTGIAHGWAGILYATLRWNQSSGMLLPAGIGERLQQLAECAEHIGQGVRWKWSVSSRRREGRDDYMSGWCNGSAGFVHLWTLAHQTFADERYLVLAEKAAWHSWESRESISNLCCGLAGQAYSLLNLYRYTGEESWLHRAKELENRAAFTVRDSAFPTDSRYVQSLYKGELGVALLAGELSRPELACMPFFEGEGWPAAQRNELQGHDSTELKSSDPQGARTSQGGTRHGIQS